MFFIFLFFNILHAHQINTYIYCDKKTIKKRRKLFLLLFFTTTLVGYLFSFIAATKSNATNNRVAGFMFILELNQLNTKKNTTIHIKINMIETNALLPMEIHLLPQQITTYLNKSWMESWHNNDLLHTLMLQSKP